MKPPPLKKSKNVEKKRNANKGNLEKPVRLLPLSKLNVKINKSKRLRKLQ